MKNDKNKRKILSVLMMLAISFTMLGFNLPCAYAGNIQANFTSPTSRQTFGLGSVVEIEGTAQGLQEVSITVRSERDSLVFAAQPEVDNGVFATSFTLDSDAAEGEYTISLSGLGLSEVKQRIILVRKLDAAINILTPSANTSWTAGSTQSITWNYTGNAGNIDIQLLIGESVSQTIARGIASSAGTYSWAIPSTLAAGSYQIKLINSSNGLIKTTSAAFNVVAAPSATITISSPTTGTSWTAGTTQPINWRYTGNVGNIDIQLLSGKSGSRPIATGIASTEGAYNWPIPNTLEAGTYQIKLISVSDSDVSSTSSGITVEAPLGIITMSSPGAGITWVTETKQTIKWTYTGTVKKVNIQLLKNGVLYQSIASTAASKKKYSWKVPAAIENATYQIKIASTTDDTIYGISDEFIISAPVTSVTLTNPSGEASWETGSTQTIKWSFEGKINKANIQLLQNGELVKTIASASAKRKSYKWKIPEDTPDGTYQVKIANANNAEVFNLSDSITIAAPVTTLNLTSPSEGAVWKLKKNQTIKWSYTGSPGKVKVSLYKGDTLIKEIGSYACKKNKTSGSCKYKPPKSLVPGVDYHIIISSTNQSGVTDESGNFKIV